MNLKNRGCKSKKRQTEVTSDKWKRLVVAGKQVHSIRYSRYFELDDSE